MKIVFTTLTLALVFNFLNPRQVPYAFATGLLIPGLVDLVGVGLGDGGMFYFKIFDPTYGQMGRVVLNPGNNNHNLARVGY